MEGEKIAIQSPKAEVFAKCIDRLYFESGSFQIVFSYQITGERLTTFTEPDMAKKPVVGGKAPGDINAENVAIPY